MKAFGSLVCPAETCRAPIALAASHSETLFDRTPTPKLLISIDGERSFRANQAFLRLIERADCIPGEPVDAHLLVDADTRTSWCMELCDTGGLAPREVEFRAETGRIGTCVLSGEVLELDGRRYGLLVAHDITAHRELEHSLRESETRFRQLAENIREVYWILDPAGPTLIYVSPAYAKVWGRPCATLYLHPTDWLDAVHPEDRPRVEQLQQNLESSGEVSEIYRIIRPDGDVRWIRDRAVPLRRPDGSIFRIVGVAEDITDQKQLEAQIVRAQRLEAVGTLAAGVVHDVNNILTPILVAAGALRDRLAGTSDEELVTVIETSATRGAEIVRQLLAFSRGADGNRARFHPRQLLREMRALVTETFPRNLTLRITAPQDLWMLHADPTHVHQVLLNLCVNARDAMPEGGTLFVAAHNETLSRDDLRSGTDVRAGRYVVFSVGDTGTGIAADILPRIFEPFFTTKSEGHGTGLGLSTVLGIVKSQGGFVCAESEVGCGTTFRVYWPAMADCEATSMMPPARTPRGGGELVLVVDDEKAVRNTVQRLLRNEGYRVLMAGDGAAALALYLQFRHEINLVITDLMMPVMDGWRLAWELRAQAATLPIIGSSGMLVGDLHRAHHSGAFTEHLAKPYDARTLLAAVSRNIARGMRA